MTRLFLASTAVIASRLTYALDFSQGLFERHKLIVATQLCMAILKKNGELQQQKFDFLLRGPKVMGMENPLKEWVLDSTWGSVQALKASKLPSMTCMLQGLSTCIKHTTAKAVLADVYMQF